MAPLKHHLSVLLPLLLCAAFALCSGVTAHAAEDSTPADPSPEARQVRLTVRNPAGQRTGRVTDRNESSFVYMPEGGTMQFTAEEGVSSLYLEWEAPCEWTLTLPDGTTQEGGKNGFMHEYMALDGSYDTFELTAPPEARLTEVYAFTDGELPDWVQRWEPPCDKADLLVLPTHVDDEYLWFGGLLPYYAGELQYRVQVVYLTDHYNAPIRNHERLNGLWTVGVTHYPVVGTFRDEYRTKASLAAATDVFGYGNVVEFQVETLRRFSPKVVVGHDIKGEYGHGAHILNAKSLLEALELTDDPTVYPESAETYGTCTVQKCYLHLWEEKPITVDWHSMPLTHFGGRTAYEVACDGFDCQVSQHRYFNMKWYSARYDCRQFGLAYTSVGDDTEELNDMFEHVEWEKPSDEQPPDVVSPADTADTDQPKALDAKSRLFAVMVVLMVMATAAVCVLGLRQKK